MRHILDKEDRVLWNRDLNNLNKWIADYVKTSKPAHPFLIVGENKGKQNDRVSSQNK